MRRAIDLGVTDFRDIIYWSKVESESESYSFDKLTTIYPEEIAASGGRMSLTLNWGNELHDAGETPFTPEGRAAFARFAEAALDAHPAISAVEVGNEFNGQNFVTGPVKDVSREERASQHFELLKAVYLRVKASHPKVAVLGGAAHSIPGGYIWPLLDLGGADYMDALVLHPYTTPPEQLARQIAVLRRHPQASDLPLQVTEFGEKGRAEAPSFLMRMYCAMALSGVERAAWYPLHDRGDGLEPLIDTHSGRPTDTGRVFARVQKMMAGRPVRDVSPDPFTIACLFGEDTLVIWGARRAVWIADGIEATNALGVTLDKVLLELSESDPIILTADERIVLGEDVKLEPTGILADSYHQFSYPTEDETFASADPFQRFARHKDRRVPLRTMPGQEAQGTPWTPYLGNRHYRPARLLADSLVPGGSDTNPVEIVHRYVADTKRVVALEASWNPSERSQDGVEITVLLNGKVLEHKSSVRDRYSVALPEIPMWRGARLDIVVGPGGNSSGDVTEYRIVLREAR
ncbi:hypothetical protein RGQ15_15240 [Paracoccus sp. MBLB3053]|uniref:Asl1-like glycosyl hydrolase catalytic domain-containing protein n=1 Tax=Paracoccus aurantius TaxID=3073814 RepID=A0ABU2HWJ0_9RHOB|nr:hypothetical protein [Paracoccus sp. MBLB3053]MDS9468920.1 hypothetical protein [Paracoccus sp. MBLB3053]